MDLVPGADSQLTVLLSASVVDKRGRTPFSPGFLRLREVIHTGATQSNGG
jgi:hypothetical protein